MAEENLITLIDWGITWLMAFVSLNYKFTQPSTFMTGHNCHTRPFSSMNMEIDLVTIDCLDFVLGLRAMWKVAITLFSSHHPHIGACLCYAE